MALLRRLLSPVLIPLAVLAVVCAALLALPFRMIEPDDDDYFYGMHAFARGKLVMTLAEARELAAIKLPDASRPGARMAPGVLSPKGFIRERSPGHYALLAGFHWLGLDRLANVVLALGVVAFFYWFVRRHLEESGETAVLASLLLIVNPTFLTMLYRVYMSDFDYFAWATVSLGLYFVARRTRRLWLCAAAGLSLGLSVFFRNTNAIAFLVVAGYEAIGAALHWLEEARARRRPGTVHYHEPFGWARAALVVACIGVGLIPLLWYSRVTTGQWLGSGYQYRLERESTAYFGLWNPRAVFSPRHLFVGELRGFMSQGYTLSVGLARVLLGYPLALLAPAGLVLMGRRRLRPALFLALWIGLFWGVYLCYRTVRADSFQFMCRKLSPALAPLAVGAAVALGQMPRKARYAAFAAVAAVSLGVTAEFFVQFVGPGQRMPMGPGPIQRPLGPMQPGPRPGGMPFEGRRPPRPGEAPSPRDLVQRLHARMREAEDRGIDVARARVLDEASKEAAGRGDWAENRRLLEEALRTVERALGRQGAPREQGEPPGPGRPRGGPL